MKPAIGTGDRRRSGESDGVMKRLIRAYPDIHMKRRGDRSRRLRARSSGSRSRSRRRRRYGNASWSTTRRRRRHGPRHARRRTRRRADGRRCASVGLSGRKAEYLRDLARAFRVGRARAGGVAGHGRRGADRSVRRGQGHRPVDGGDVPDVPRAARRRAAGRRHRPPECDGPPLLRRRPAGGRRRCARWPHAGGPTAASRRGTCGARSIRSRSSIESVARPARAALHIDRRYNDK